MNSEVDWKENRYAETEHHIFAKSLGWLSVEANKIKLYDAFHCADHRMFWTLLFREKILKIIAMDKTALADIKEDLLKLLQEKDLSYYYKDWIYIRK
jgi:hypothetical protein